MEDSKWIPIWKQLPNKSMKVQWLCSDGVEDIGFYYKDHNEFASIELNSTNEITHWKPFTEFMTTN